MSNAYRRRNSFRFTDGRVAAEFHEEVQEFPIHHLPAAYTNPGHYYPRTYDYACPPAIPQGPYYGLPYQSHPTIRDRPVPLITYPNTQATYYQSPSPYPPGPQQQFGGSDRGSNRGPSPSVASTPYVHANSVQGWAHGVHGSNNPSSDSIHSDAQYVRSSSRRSERRDDRDRRRDDKRSRRSFVYSSSYDSGSDYRDYKTDAGSRADRLRLEPQPQMIRRGSTAQEPIPYYSYRFHVGQAR